MADKILPGQSVPARVEETVADPKAEALRKHLQTLRQESPEALAKRYKISSEHSRALGELAEKMDQLVDLPETTLYRLLGIEHPSSAAKAAAEAVSPVTGGFGSILDLRGKELQETESRRSRTAGTADEIIDKLRRENQTSLGDK